LCQRKQLLESEKDSRKNTVTRNQHYGAAHGIESTGPRFNLHFGWSRGPFGQSLTGLYCDHSHILAHGKLRLEIE
jgi:hypothetical protein